MKQQVAALVVVAVAIASGAQAGPLRGRSDRSADPGSETAACFAAGGSFVTGTIVRPPRYAPGSLRNGVELSHTHVTLRSDQDGQSYDVAIDNVFAAGYDEDIKAIPAPLDRLAAGTRVELCGKPYTDGGGFDWVHTNCGKRPTRGKPDGWIKTIGANGVSENLEGSTDYCSLWDRRDSERGGRGAFLRRMP